jgi:alpha-L-fucosidase
LQPQILVSQRVGNEYGDIACPGDNKIPKDANEYAGPWEGIGTMNNSWGFKHYDHDWKYPKETLFWLIELVSKGGNYMLNIGPDGEGNIPRENIDILNEIGKWLSTYGDAIYGTRRWHVTHEGPTTLDMEGTQSREEEGFNSNFTMNDFWFTKKENTVYAISLYSGKADKMVVKSLMDCEIKEISLLGEEGMLEWQKTQTGVEIKLPDAFESKYGFALKFELA